MIGLHFQLQVQRADAANATYECNGQTVHIYILFLNFFPINELGMISTAMCVNINLLLIKLIDVFVGYERFVLRRNGKIIPGLLFISITMLFMIILAKIYIFFTILVGRPTWYVISTSLCEYMFPNGKTYEFI